MCVLLDDPVDFGNVEPARSDVRTQQDSLLGVDKLEKGRCPLLLLLLSVDVEHGNVDIVQELRVELDAVAAAEKHHHLFVEVFLEKGEQEQESKVARADDVSLEKKARERES